MSSMRNEFNHGIRKRFETVRVKVLVKGALFAQTRCDLSVLDEANMWDIACNLCENDLEEKNQR